MTTWEIPVPMVETDRHGRACPWTLNDRPPWTTRRMHAARIKSDVAWRVKQQKIPPQDHVTVQLHYAPGDNRRRDADNLVATSKPAVDALVRSGVVRDDSPQYVTQLMPTIHAGNQERRLWLVITDDAPGGVPDYRDTP
jgi:crossover junction endodeoxyribonuclease RusA